MRNLESRRRLPALDQRLCHSSRGMALNEASRRNAELADAAILENISTDAKDNRAIGCRSQSRKSRPHHVQSCSALKRTGLIEISQLCKSCSPNGPKQELKPRIMKAGLSLASPISGMFGIRIQTPHPHQSIQACSYVLRSARAKSAHVYAD